MMTSEFEEYGAHLKASLSKFENKLQNGIFTYDEASDLIASYADKVVELAEAPNDNQIKGALGREIGELRAKMLIAMLDANKYKQQPKRRRFLGIF